MAAFPTPKIANIVERGHPPLNSAVYPILLGIEKDPKAHDLMIDFLTFEDSKKASTRGFSVVLLWMPMVLGLGDLKKRPFIWSCRRLR